jgi:hypothetical protein
MLSNLVPLQDVLSSRLIWKFSCKRYYYYLPTRTLWMMNQLLSWKQLWSHSFGLTVWVDLYVNSLPNRKVDGLTALWPYGRSTLGRLPARTTAQSTLVTDVCATPTSHSPVVGRPQLGQLILVTAIRQL